jgi:hypothetical protein
VRVDRRSRELNGGTQMYTVQHSFLEMMPVTGTFFLSASRVCVAWLSIFLCYPHIYAHTYTHAHTHTHTHTYTHTHTHTHCCPRTLAHHGSGRIGAHRQHKGSQRLVDAIGQAQGLALSHPQWAQTSAAVAVHAHICAAEHAHT